VIGAGTVSNHDRSVGSACIAERRMIETLENRPLTPFLCFGDRLSIDVRNAAGASVFGAIEQLIVHTASIEDCHGQQ
jgi:fumarylacetoacetate (FAA) hydrolase